MSGGVQPLNLNKAKDAFEEEESGTGPKQGLVHIRIQMRTGRKTITTVQGIAAEYDLKKIVRYLKKTCIPIGLPVLILSICIDRIFYGRWLISAWNFLSFNVLKGGSAHFGSNPWHWYLSVGLPTVLGPHLVPILLGMCRSGAGAKRLKPLAYLCIWYVSFHSVLAHKEQRFLLPVVPLLCMYAGDWLYSVARPNAKVKNDSPDVTKGHDQSPMTHYWKFVSKKAKVYILLLYIINLPIALYTGLLHQRGALDLTWHIRDWSGDNPNNSYWLLTPCHSTPMYSHIHLNVSIKTLNCDPNLESRPNYVDEADVFFENPIQWLNSFVKTQPLPSKVVMYDNLWPKVEKWFMARQFNLCGNKIFNSHFPQSSRQSQYFVVICSNMI